MGREKELPKNWRYTKSKRTFGYHFMHNGLSGKIFFHPKANAIYRTNNLNFNPVQPQNSDYEIIFVDPNNPKKEIQISLQEQKPKSHHKLPYSTLESHLRVKPVNEKTKSRLRKLIEQLIDPE